MYSIHDARRNVFKNEKEVLKKSNDISNYARYDWIELVSVEESVALWRKYNEYADYRYFFTDLEGNLLFEGTTFINASPLSKGKCLVTDYHATYILNSRKKTLTELPKEIKFSNISFLRNNNFAICDKDLLWSGYHFNTRDNSFEQIVPPIWNHLDFSRRKDAFVGVNKIVPIISKCPLDKYEDDFGADFYINVLKLGIEDIQDKEVFDKLYKYYSGKIYQKDLRFIIEKLDSRHDGEIRNMVIEKYNKTYYNIADMCFYEKHYVKAISDKTNLDNFKDLGEYKKVLGKVKSS